MNNSDFTEMMIALDLEQHPLPERLEYRDGNGYKTNAYYQAVTAQQPQQLARIQRTIRQQGDYQVTIYWCHNSHSINHQGVWTLAINGGDVLIDADPNEVDAYIIEHADNEDIVAEESFFRPLSGRERRQSYNRLVAADRSGGWNRSYSYGPGLFTNDPQGEYR